MDATQRSRANARSWAQMVLDDNQSTTQDNEDAASEASFGSSSSSSTASLSVSDLAQTVQPARGGAARWSYAQNTTPLREASHYQRIPSATWRVDDTTILPDPLAHDSDPFAGFPTGFLTRKADYCVTRQGETSLAEQCAPVDANNMPNFDAVLHLSRVLEKQYSTMPTIMPRDTLGLADNAYLVVPLDGALGQLNTETITKAKFGVQHLQAMTEQSHYPIRFSLGGRIMTPGASAAQLGRRKMARDELNGFWLTFSHYANINNTQVDDAARYEKVNHFMAERMGALFQKYLSFEDKPALQNALCAVAKFFSAVFSTADFNCAVQRSFVLQKLMVIYDAILEDNYLLESVANEARENMANCEDRRALVLGDMEMMVLMHQCARGKSTENLFSAGLSLMRTHICDRHAFKSAVPNRKTETTEVILRFRIALADLGLAVSTQNMSYEAVAHVEDYEIERARRDIQEATRNLNQVQQFFRQCTPWISHVEAIGTPALTALSERAQNAMNDLFSRQQSMLNQDYVDACNALMVKWQEEKDAELMRASDELVARLHANTLETLGPQVPLNVI